jgi:tripartite-type tricarboxylate transporter receptor subunit TctC
MSLKALGQINQACRTLPSTDVERNMNRRAFIASALATVSAIAASSRARAQSYPTRLIKLVVPSPPGGPHEAVVRSLADRLSASLGRPVIVENLPGGAGGSIGARSVARAEPDGYTLLVSLPGALVAAPAIYRNLGYDPAKDFTPIATVFSSPQMLAVNSALPVRSVQEFVAHAKANPGKISFPSPGYGTGPHLLGELFKQVSNIDIVHVPYKGVAGIADLLAGRLQMGFETVPVLLPHIQAGILRALAVADSARNSQLPDVPTTIESGVPSLQATLWMGVLAPTGTPVNIVNRLNVTINGILQSKDLVAALDQLGAQPKIGSPQDFGAFMAQERQRWTQVINAAGIRVD